MISTREFFSAPPSVKNSNYRFLPLSELKWNSEPLGSLRVVVKAPDQKGLAVVQTPVTSSDDALSLSTSQSTQEFLGAWIDSRHQTLTSIDIAQGVAAEAPLHVRVSGESGFAKTQVTLKAHARAQCVFEFDGVGEGFAGHALEVLLGEGSQLELFIFQNYSLATQFALSDRVTLAKDAALKVQALHVGGGKGRHHLESRTAGTGSRLEYKGATRVDGKQKIDFWVDVEHSVPHTSSDLEYLTVAAGQAQVHFNGMVRILQTAPFTEAYQKNKNLPLSAEAVIQSSPKLEISVDEVKCAHGSSTATISDDQLVYLMSRGIDEDESRKMIVEGWTEPLVEKFALEEVKARIRQTLSEKTV